MEKVLVIPLLISFIATLFILPYWIKKAKDIGLIWEDMNKPPGKKVPGSGGIIVVLGFILGVLIYISIKTFYFQDQGKVIEILALVSSILILAGIGLVDDLLGWQHGGLSKKTRIILCVFAAVPLIVINAGDALVNIPLLGQINLYWFYALALVPLAIVGASTTFNMMAGYNGLEASQGILILGALSFIGIMRGQTWLALIGLCFVVSLIAFYFYNKYPADIFPGDVLTYSVGGMIAIMAILGNMEKVAVFFFIPYILETGLKLRGGLNKYSFGKPNNDGSLEVPYDKFYGIEHIAIYLIKKIKRGGKVYEREVVWAINIFQIILIIIGILIFKKSIFL